MAATKKVVRKSVRKVAKVAKRAKNAQRGQLKALEYLRIYSDYIKSLKKGEDGWTMVLKSGRRITGNTARDTMNELRRLRKAGKEKVNGKFRKVVTKRAAKPAKRAAKRAKSAARRR